MAASICDSSVSNDAAIAASKSSSSSPLPSEESLDIDSLAESVVCPSCPLIGRPSMSTHFWLP